VISTYTRSVRTIEARHDLRPREAQVDATIAASIKTTAR